MASIANRGGKRGTRAGVSIRLENKSIKETFSQLNHLAKLAPKEAFKGLKSIAIEIVNNAQNKLKSDRHIITGRLRNSITTYFRGKKKDTYKDDDGKTYSSKIALPLLESEVAAGTNVEYALDIEKKDSFLNHAINTTKGERVDKILKRVANNIEKEANL